MKIYTRTGDRGETSLLGGARVRKDHPRIEAYGTVDELNSYIGVVRALWAEGPIDEELASIQRDLFEIGAQLASDSARFAGVGPERVADLEREIDTMEEKLPPLTAFILPGGSMIAAHLHVARTVCRRAERLVIALANEESRPTVAYLNRLSDYLFVAARFANLKA
ncbi:MAG TPA: cob(I)yrinic acid a,c-diamide adenosyltransferase, partial [Thermoanaerobaculia bacterium]|nr:cob(I)yrinic acid a,c-diamide adenosyltransferase [Thermoanaerobaculia bacterium]